MTGGRPRADFTAHVMAPIEGGPQPWFTARVMHRLDRPARRRITPGALILIPAALALVTGAMVLRGPRVARPTIPGAPPLASAASGPRMPATPADPRTATRVIARAAAPEPEIVTPQIYMIAALEGPAGIAMKSIEPASVAVTPLAVTPTGQGLPPAQSKSHSRDSPSR